jgi:hypothetical protein
MTRVIANLSTSVDGFVGPVQLEDPEPTEAADVTHLRYRARR